MVTNERNDQFASDLVLTNNQLQLLDGFDDGIAARAIGSGVTFYSWADYAMGGLYISDLVETNGSTTITLQFGGAGNFVYRNIIESPEIRHNICRTRIDNCLNNKRRLIMAFDLTTNANFVTQTGTDADLSALTSLTGIEVITSGTRTFYKLPGGRALRVQGTLSFPSY